MGIKQHHQGTEADSTQSRSLGKIGRFRRNETSVFAEVPSIFFSAFECDLTGGGETSKTISHFHGSLGPFQVVLHARLVHRSYGPCGHFNQEGNSLIKLKYCCWFTS